MENEITVLVTCDYEKLDKELKKYNFEIKEAYEMNDDYMIDSNVDLKNFNTLEILQKCVLVRDMVGITKQLVFKNKEYAPNGDIISQSKIKCIVNDIDEAVSFMEAINYKKIFTIYDKCIVYANKNTELVVQLVNNKYIFIEMESKCQYIEKEYQNIEDMIDDLNKYDLPFSKESYFVKKAEIILKESLEGVL